MTASLLEIESLRVEIAARQRKLVVIDDVSFSIARGEVLGVIGESGAGKSITASAILGLLEPPAYKAAGSIRLGGRRIDGLSEEEMRALRGREIGAVFQDPLTSLNPLLTIGKQLVQTITTHLDVPHKEAWARAHDLLVEVGIPAPQERLRSYPHQFSGGMRQRVVLALAFACEPRLIVADEPTTALDVSVQAQVIDVMKRMCSERATAVMLITHDMGVIAEAADRLAVMYAGRIVEMGPVADVLSRPAHPYSRGLMASIPTLRQRSDEDLPQIPGSMPRLGAFPTGCTFHPRCKMAVQRCAAERPELRPFAASSTACWVAQGNGPMANTGTGP